eukprot:TRINITY_DN32498_c0_g1_i1.p1 TRINITY_DN32498_c0_g1~~TRINITY_DN32498_c0_g1_i1.p1  ORF type:complete len:324 (+),score=62.86 TRINITY_DN32498_c0_g1_i1:71-1042(+)
MAPPRVLVHIGRGTIVAEDQRRLRSRGRHGGLLMLCSAAVLIAFASWNNVPGSASLQADADDEEGTHTLVLLRHGESQWNLENRFTGWVDVDVSKKGAAEASNAGKLLREANLSVDLAFTSLQKRAIKTLALALEEMDQLWVPVQKSWRLNERMYGDLQGMNKAETTAKFGEAQVTQWRRSFAVPPPPIKDDNPYHPKLDPKYKDLGSDLPLAESLALTIDRVLPFWRSAIAPALRSGKTVIIAAHGNSLRALVKYLDGISEDKIIGLNIPTAVPLVYKLNRRLQPIAQPGHAEGLSARYLGDPKWVDEKINGVKNQAKAAAR